MSDNACATCDGEGEVECSHCVDGAGYEHDDRCPKCGGVGCVECPSCNGRKTETCTPSAGAAAGDGGDLLARLIRSRDRAMGGDVASLGFYIDFNDAIARIRELEAQQRWLKQIATGMTGPFFGDAVVTPLDGWNAYRHAADAAIKNGMPAHWRPNGRPRSGSDPAEGR